MLKTLSPKAFLIAWEVNMILCAFYLGSLMGKYRWKGRGSVHWDDVYWLLFWIPLCLFEMYRNLRKLRNPTIPAGIK
jgi:hypothetical protein